MQEVVELDNLPRMSDIIGHKMVTQSGRLLGVIDDVLINRADGTIVGFVVGEGVRSKLENIFNPQRSRVRGYVRAECIAVGDSREDLGAADAVGTFWFVANAVERDPSLRLAAADQGNVRIAEARHGAGVYEAVVSTLAERR